MVCLVFSGCMLFFGCLFFVSSVCGGVFLVFVGFAWLFVCGVLLLLFVCWCVVCLVGFFCFV